MDVLFFLKERIGFIRQFYCGAVVPFDEQIRRIEAGEDPYVPPYSEDEEPPFLAEWVQADESRDALGHACVSMLAASLKLFLEIHDRPREMKCLASFKKTLQGRGWFHAYRECFDKALSINWSESPADLLLLKEIVLTRNKVQHPESIHTLGAKLSPRDVKILQKRVIFIDPDYDMSLVDLEGGEFAWIFAPNVRVTKESLFKACDEVELFCMWLESKIKGES